MQNSYVSLHRTLDTTIQNLESQINPNQSFITDLKKKKLQLKEHIALGKPLPKGAHSKLASMLHSHKVNEKMKRKQRKIAKHAYDEELKRRLQNLSSQLCKSIRKRYGTSLASLVMDIGVLQLLTNGNQRNCSALIVANSVHMTTNSLNGQKIRGYWIRLTAFLDKL